jgi:hypothetical protein
MKFFLQLRLFLICNIGLAQNNSNVEKQKDTLMKDKTKIEKPTNGGVSKFYKYISDNFRAPNVSGFPGGKEIVEFTIKTDGTVRDIKIIKDIGYGVGEQIKKILKNSPKWTPAVKDGQPIDCTFTLPIKIQGNYED